MIDADNKVYLKTVYNLLSRKNKEDYMRYSIKKRAAAAFGSLLIFGSVCFLAGDTNKIEEDVNVISAQASTISGASLAYSTSSTSSTVSGQAVIVYED